MVESYADSEFKQSPDKPDLAVTLGADDARRAPPASRTVVIRPRKRKTGPRFDLCFLGDTCMGETYQAQRESRGRENVLKTKGVEHCLSGLQPLLARADYTIANLETPVTDLDGSARTGKAYVHKGDPQLTAELLRRSRVGAVSLANNHAFDHGSAGLAQTLDVLDAHGCRAFGAGRSAAEAAEPLIIKLDAGQSSLTVALVAGCTDPDLAPNGAGAGLENGPQVRFLDVSRTVEQIRALKAEQPGIMVICFPHWGRNYRWCSPSQSSAAAALIAAGADLILGHGAHMLQQLERYDEKWVAFSLGNFVFNSPGRYAMFTAPPFSMMARLIAIPKAETWSLSVRFYPIVSDNLQTDWCPRHVNDSEFEAIRYLLAAKSKTKLPQTGRDRVGHYLQIRVK